jgi:phosphatidylserine decarboxylase
MRIDRAGYPFIAAALAPAAALVVARRPGWAVPFLALGGFFAYFFRDPDRQVPGDPWIVVSPADGRVLVAGPAIASDAPPGEWLQVSIFLSPVDVHINRSAASGRVARIEYHPGRFLPAFRKEAASENERTEIWIDHQGQWIVMRQVVGILARRIVCRIQEGAEIQAGERFGMMKFGSRMDVFVPTTATLLVSVGDAVRAGETVIALLQPSDPDTSP